MVYTVTDATDHPSTARLLPASVFTVVSIVDELCRNVNCIIMCFVCVTKIVTIQATFHSQQVAVMEVLGKECKVMTLNQKVHFCILCYLQSCIFLNFCLNNCFCMAFSLHFSDAAKRRTIYSNIGS